jgi:hypothetical protein
MNFFNKTVNKMMLMNLKSEASLLLDIEKNLKENNTLLAKKKLVVLADTLDEKRLYKVANEVDTLLKFSIYGFLTEEAEEENFKRDQIGVEGKGLSSPEKDPEARTVKGRVVRKLKSKLYFKVIKGLGLEDGTVAAKFVENTIATFTTKEVKNLYFSRDCSIIDRNVYEGMNITVNNLYLEPDVIEKVKLLSTEIATIVLGLPEGSLASEIIEDRTTEEMVYKIINNLPKDKITKRIRDRICSEVKNFRLTDLIKELF